MRQNFFLIVLFVLLLFCENIYTQEFTKLSLNGYLGKEELVEARKILGHLAGGQLILEVNSSSGDSIEVLDLAKKIYEAKIEKKVPVIVYIQDNALGPAAILPFLADKLYISSFVSWGDITLDTDYSLPTNVLRNQVSSLISPDNPKSSVLQILAAAMTDKTVRIVNDHGWRLAWQEKDENLPLITNGQAPLVVNQNQLKELGLISGIMTAEKFAALFKELPSIENGAQVPATADSETALDKKLREHIKFDPKTATTVGLITIDDRSSGISQATWLYVKNALDYYKQSKPSFIILELNTPGGEVFAAQKISDALKDMDTQYNIPIVAFINNWAISAGAMLAYSSRFIAIAKDASMGAAEPITIGDGEAKTASEKVNSALRADFANRASFFGRNPNIAEAMVDKDIILVLRHGRIIKLDNEDQIHKSGPDADIIISQKGKLLTLNSEQLMKDGVADILLQPQKLGSITAKEKETGKWPAGKMLLFTYPFFAQMKDFTTIDHYIMDWKTQFFVWLAHPVVSSILFLGFLIGFYVELNTPGFGLAGTVAFTCLFLIILSSFSQDIANWLEVILLLTGLSIILVELFILPTFGLLGFIGILFFFAGLFGLMLPGISSINFEFDTQTWNAAGEAFFKRLAWLSGTMVLAFFICLLLTRYISPNLAGMRRFVLTGHEQEGYHAGANAADLPQPGKQGEAITTLRPAGKIMIDDQIYDAMTAGGFVEKGEKIVIDHLEGNVIFVSRIG